MFSQQITHKRLSPARPLVLALFFVSFSIALKPLFAQMTPLEQQLQTIHQQRINAQNSLTPDVNLINSLRNQEQQLLDLVTQLRVQSQKLGGIGGGPPGGQSGMGAGGPGQTMMMQNNLQQLQRAGAGAGGSPSGMMGGSPGGMMGGMMGGTPGGMMGGTPGGMMGGSPGGMMGAPPGGMMVGPPGGGMGGGPMGPPGGGMPGGGGPMLGGGPMMGGGSGGSSSFASARSGGSGFGGGSFSSYGQQMSPTSGMSLVRQSPLR